MTKQNKVLRLTEELLNQPHLITQQAFEPILKYLDDRNAGVLEKLEMPDDEDDSEEPKRNKNYDSMLKVGTIEVWGSLTNKPMYAFCGGVVGQSYQGILYEANELIKLGATTIILNIDSGGGQAFNAMESAEELRQACDDKDVELIGYVQSCACSAAYVWASVCDMIISHPQGQTGSIGVLIGLINDSKRLDKEGYVRTFITAGKEKIPFDKDGEWKESFLQDLQEKVDALYSQFVSHVSKYTGLSAGEIESTEAKTYIADKALQIGLINNIMTYSEFANFIKKKQIEKGVF